MTVSFCLPEEYFPSAAWQEAWKEGKILPLQEEGKIATTQGWIYQTWAWLTMIAVPCFLFPQMPDHGIVIVLSGSLSKDCKPPEDVFLVDVVADGLPHPAAHWHIIQNKVHADRLPRSVFMAHWPQPCLIKRSPERGDRFENIAFFGHLKNLAPELQSPTWIKKLREELGLELRLHRADRWDDYSDTDAVIAIRNFSSSRELHKPATKLYNAWLAGVPFIGGTDSAYAADGQPGKDYLVARSAEEVFAHLKRLKEDPILRASLVAEGIKSGEQFTQSATLERWRNLVETTLPQRANEWFKMSKAKRRMLSTIHRACCFVDRHWR